MSTIEGHHDFAVLERRLAELILETRQADRRHPFPPVAIVAPTRRLLTHLQIRLAERLGALLNVHFFHHQSLASAALAVSGAALPAPLHDDVKTEILAALIQARGGPLADYAAARPGTVASILSTLDDLREAGLSAGAAEARSGVTAAGRDLLGLYARYCRTIDAAGPALTDRAGWLRHALAAVEDYSRRFRLAVHYGAYDLIGVNLELMRAVGASAGRLVYLAPLHPSSRAYEPARRFWPEMLGAEPSEIRGDAGTDSLLAGRLPFLYEESARPPALSSATLSRLDFFHAQGAEAELREVALGILALHRDEGVPLDRIGVIARSLEPYAAMLRPVFQEHALPFTTSASCGALRESRVQAALQLARSVLRDFPRQPLMDLFRGGLLRLEGRDPSRRAHLWDRLSRSWRVSGGYTTWKDDLPRWIAGWEPYLPPGADEEERAAAASHKKTLSAEVTALAGAVEGLRRVAQPLERATSWGAWAEAFERILRDRLEGFAGAAEDADLDPGAEAVLSVLSEIRRLDAASIPFAGDRALGFLEHALARAVVPLGSIGGGAVRRGADNGGVRVLDAMQARGLWFDAVYLIGCNADLFPRRAAEDPFLPDGDRRLLREKHRVPLPIKLAAHDEERLLLAHILGSARRRLTVSWQRADESGKARVPSLALREIARLVYGEPDTGRLVDGARRVKAHPGEAAVDALRRYGMLPPADACVDAALQARSPARLLQTVADLPLAAPTSPAGESLRAGLTMLAAIDEWDGAAPGSLRFDAFVGRAAGPPARVSPTRLEILGSCPQHYFFRYVLRVREMDEVREDHEFDAREIGTRIHSVLHDVYQELVGPDGSLPPDEPVRLLARALETARRAWRRHTGDIAARARTRYPLLWESTEEIWWRALEGFLNRDLAALRSRQARVLGLEREHRAYLSLGVDGGSTDLLGRFDRLTASPEGVVVTDYKTSGAIESHVSPTQILKGTRLQVPLYLLLAEALAGDGRLPAPPARGEVLGVGPAFAPDSAIVCLDRPTLDRYREGLLETLRVLLDLVGSGSYPLNDTSRLCEHCPYLRACRRSHVPTVHRVTRAQDGARYARLRLKNRYAPLLDEVGRNAGNGDES
ncbi:MAG: hypothetical protein DMF51_14745 [Acidobacteria bacterium]|nr:MAG: hypothetical protein DMF51_14745 [Acidobacteriota bacterium]